MGAGHGSLGVLRCKGVSRTAENAEQRKSPYDFGRKGMNSLWCARRDSNARPLAPEANNPHLHLFSSIFFLV